MASSTSSFCTNFSIWSSKCCIFLLLKLCVLILPWNGSPCKNSGSIVLLSHSQGLLVHDASPYVYTTRFLSKSWVSESFCFIASIRWDKFDFKQKLCSYVERSRRISFWSDRLYTRFSFNFTVLALVYVVFSSILWSLSLVCIMHLFRSLIFLFIASITVPGATMGGRLKWAWSWSYFLV